MSIVTSRLELAQSLQLVPAGQPIPAQVLETCEAILARYEVSTDITPSGRTGCDPEPRISAYTVSRIPDDSPNAGIWDVRVEATGKGRWAVRHHGRCLSRAGEWNYEPLPSSRTEAWLKRHRWDDADEAIAAAVEAEAGIVVNGMTSADVLAGGSDHD